MDIINFNNVSFKYEQDENFQNNGEIFKNLNINLPEGVISLMGQNGTGKSSFLLLASGLLIPTEGSITIFNKDTKEIKDLNDRQKLVSFVYQNMEFETEENIGDLLNYVYDNGHYKEKKIDFIPELVKVFELDRTLGKKTQNISKGELQRVIIAFSLLYGSKIIMMDEPIFALEEKQKVKVMEYLFNFAHKSKVSIYCSLHDIDLSKKFSDYSLLFYLDKQPELGETNKIFTREKIEEVYNVPFALLRSKEKTFREALLDIENFSKEL